MPTINNFPYSTFSSFKEVDTAIFVSAGQRPVRITETPKEKDMSREVYRKAANKSSVQDHQLIEQVLKGEYKILNRDVKANATPIGDVHYNIDL